MPKERKKVLCMDAQRHAEYYGMQQTFDELYAKSKAGEVFNGLMELVRSPTTTAESNRSRRQRRPKAVWRQTVLPICQGSTKYPWLECSP